MTRTDIAQGVSTRTVILGPYGWHSGTEGPLRPGQSKFFAKRILSSLHGVSQVLEALTVTAVARPASGVQAVGVTDLCVVEEASGALGVNFNVTNLHAWNDLFAFDFHIAIIVPE
ncbi:hypothetical protein HEK616_84000 (plasmid) [Streptomyces nigrescens]|uniref:Uncharacterized protein n=1 Tax=Streptomyces nigrescens TaxID=1920 RepID=A0ABN6RCJ6_STRNI|nr:hypothetical protein [Streptomyces nigrescens]BDM74913.1 hypothetical protein HEK616_84000 [Streptomyces nigrescens]